MTRQVDVKSLVSHIVRGDGLDKCRICMGDTSQGQVHLTDTVMMDGDKAVTLTELLVVLTGVEVEWEEALPSTVCLTCSISALEAAEFRNFVHKTHQQWIKAFQSLERLADQKYSAKTNKLMATVSNDIIITVKTYDIDISDNSNDIDIPNDFDCNIRDESVKPPKAIKEIAKTKRNGKMLNCQCPTCGKRFRYASLLNRHLKESADLIRACQICAAVMNRNELIKHLKKVHNLKSHDCKRCPALFLNSELYSEHVIKAHSSGAWTCGDCSHRFTSLPAFHAHQSIHVRRSCPNCDRNFHNQMCYTYHVKKCCKLDTKGKEPKVTVTLQNKNQTIKMGKRGSLNSKCICDYCNKIFSGKKFVAAHIEIVHTKATHSPCAKCGKLYAAAHMSTHIQSHEKKHFKCGQCGAVLKSKLGFKQHQRLHTGERPYKCDYCGESFCASSRRSEHIRNKHSKAEAVLRYCCTICSTKFRLPSKLKSHVRRDHIGLNGDMIWYECAMCHDKFASYRSLLFHTKKKHF